MPSAMHTEKPSSSRNILGEVTWESYISLCWIFSTKTYHSFTEPFCLFQLLKIKNLLSVYTGAISLFNLNGTNEHKGIIKIPDRISFILRWGSRIVWFQLCGINFISFLKMAQIIRVVCFTHFEM